MQTKFLLTKNWMLNVLLLVLFALCGAGEAMAVGSGTAADPYILEDGGEYEMKAFNPFFCKFEAPADGKLTLLTNSSFAVYEDTGDKETQFTVVDTSIDPNGTVLMAQTTVSISSVRQVRPTIWDSHSRFPAVRYACTSAAKQWILS